MNRSVALVAGSTLIGHSLLLAMGTAFIGLTGCGMQPQGQSLEATSIRAGIYTGPLVCDGTTVWGTGDVQDSDPLTFTTTFIFNENGLPEHGPGYDPNHDVMTFGAYELNVTKRTYSSTQTTVVQQRALDGRADAWHLNGNSTARLDYKDDTTITVRIDSSITGNVDGTGLTYTESCTGELSQ